MTEIERAILRNQLALLCAAYTLECHNESEVRRRMRATEVLLYDPTLSCGCPRGGPTRFLDTSHGATMVCELCDHPTLTSGR
jgi:hypothetical protein